MVQTKELVYESYLTIAESCDYMTRWVAIYDKYAEAMKDTIIHSKDVVANEEGGDTPETDKVDLRGKSKEINALLEELRLKLKRSRAMNETISMSEAHAIRRQSFSSIQMYIKSNRHSGTAENRAAAERLHNITINFKISNCRTYADFSASITSFLTVLRSEKNTADVQLLNLEDRMTELEEANNTFIALDALRGTTKEENGVPASTVYRSCYNSFNYLIRFLNGVFIYYVHDQFQAFANELNGITSGYQLTINKRKAESKRVKDDVKPEDEASVSYSPDIPGEVE